jgi:hypothetical protein
VSAGQDGAERRAQAAKTGQALAQQGRSGSSGNFLPLNIGNRLATARSAERPHLSHSPALKFFPALAVGPITVSMTDALVNDDGDNKIDPTNGTPATEERITYTVTITNTGSDPATHVKFSAPIDSHTTLVPNTINTSPIAGTDSYSASGNIPISLNVAGGVMANDFDPDTGDKTGVTVTEVQGSAANVGVATNTTQAGRGGVKGSVTLFDDGHFTYEPPPGFTGDDTFTYKITDAKGATDTTTVTITITGMVWFIQNGAPGSGIGTFSNPFKTIAAFNTANTSGTTPDPKNGDIIALRTGTYSETDGINLRNTQKLFGEAIQFNTVFTASTNSSSAYNTFASGTATAPTINTTGGNGIDLADSNTVRGLTVGNTPGFFDFSGGAVGSPVIDTVSVTGTGGAINIATSGAFGANVNFLTLESSSSPTANISLVGVTGTLGVTSGGAGLSGSAASSNAIHISGGSVSLSYPGNVTKANAGALLNVTGGHSGTLTFTGTLSATAGTGLQFTNSDGTYNFNGTTTLNGGDAGIDIGDLGVAGTGSAGTFSFNANTSITDPTNEAIAISSSATSPSAPTVTYSGSFSKSNGTRGILVQNNTAGTTINFDGASATETKSISTSGASNAIDLLNNSNATINFTGNNLVLAASGSGAGLNATGGGTITVQGTGNTISTATGTALNVATTSIGAGGLTFLSISSNGGTNGIVLNNVGTGGLTVTGTGTTAGSGGTIQNKTQGAVFMTMSNLSLKNMNFTNAGNGSGTCSNVETTAFNDNSVLNSGCQAAINLRGVTTATLDRLVLDGGLQNGINGQTVSGLTISNSTVKNFGDNVNEDPLRLFNVTGTCSITNSTFQNGGEFLADIRNITSTALNLTVNNVIFTDTDTSAFGAAGFSITGAGTSNITLLVDNSTFTKIVNAAFQVIGKSTAVMNVDFTDSSVEQQTAATGRSVDIGAQNSAQINFNVNRNSKLYSKGGTSVNIYSFDTATIQGHVNNNTDIRCGGVGSPGTGVSFQPQDDSVGRIEIASNTISQIGSTTDAGIRILAFGDGGSEVDATADATITNNNITLISNGLTGGSYIGGLFGVQTQAGSNATDSIETCADLQNNAVSATPNAINGTDNTALRTREGSATSQLYLEGMSAGASNAARALNTWTARGNTPAHNSASDAAGAPNYSAPPAGAPYNGVCRTPTNLTAMLNLGDDFRNTVAQVSAPPEFVSGTATLWASLAKAENNPASGTRQIKRISDLLARQARTTIALYTERPRVIDEPVLEGFASAAIGADPHASLVATDASATGVVAAAVQQPVVETPAATAINATAQAGTEATNTVARAASQTAETVAAAPQSKRRDMILSHAVKMRTRPSALAAAAALVSGETVTVDGGAGVSPANSGFTLPGSKTITITFQVTLNNPPNVTFPWPTGGPQVSTQGTVTADGPVSVQTDDPTPPAPLTNGSTDPTVTYVDLFNSQTALASDDDTVNQNDSVTFTATVSLNPVGSPAGTPPTPTGTVDFYDGTAVPANAISGCTGKTLDGTGKATCTTSSLPAGVHTITAVYNGDGNYETSTGTTSQTVIACATNPVVTSTSDDGSNPATLRYAITNICSAPNNNITFNLGAGPHTITTASTLVIAKNVNITNTLSGTNGTVTIDAGGGNFNVFRVDSPVTSASISNLTVTGANATSISGGGLLVQSGTVTLTGMLFTGNTVINGDGGGVTAGSSSTVNIRNSTISGNTAREGGGLASSGGTFDLLNVTITNNNANGNTGTGACPAAGSINGAGGGIDTNNNITYVTNTIISGNTACSPAQNASGAFTTVSNDVFDGDPKLAALADNGGVTRTHALLAGSPALDAGDNAAVDAVPLTTDQRGTGYARKRDAADSGTTQTVDIGAFEADPSIEDIQNKTTPEDTPLVFTIQVGDGDAAATAFDSITGTSSDTALVPNANVVIGAGSGGGGGGPTRSVTITPAADKSGTTTITITATKTINGTVLSMSDSFDLTVTPVNDAPTVTADPIASVAEDSGQRTIPISDLLANDLKGPADESGQTLTLTAVGTPVGGTVSNDATNVYFTPTADFNGAASFQYTITDDGTSGSPAAADPKVSSGAVTFTITEVNDAPTATADSLTAVAEDSGQRAIPFSDLVTNDSKGPANESTQTLVVKTVTNAVGGSVVLDTPNSQVLFTPAADFTGTASFDYTVEDNGTTNGSSNPQTSAAAATVSFTVTPVADAPSVTNATTNEDTQSTSGLVISRNANDGTEVTHFKITNITNGTLFKSDGTTQITNNSFITFAEGQAGLRFTPTADLYSPSTTFSFQVQAATDGTGTGLSAGLATATITVNAVGDTPSVTNATTDEDTQSTSGLVITKNAVDGAEVTHFKITNITGGTLYKNDGTTQISNGGFITLAEGGLGLKFTPTADLVVPGSFRVQAALDGTGTGLSPNFATATIFITPIADTPSITATTTAINTQSTSGLVISRNTADGAEVTHFKITNITGGTLYKNNGTTQINNGDFITFAEGQAGLKFTPGLNLSTSGGDTFGFDVYAATNGSGAGLSTGFASASITVDCQTGLVVTSTLDDGSAGTLRHAVLFSCPGSTITFDSTAFAAGGSPYTLTLGSELFINKNLTITGPTASRVILSGGGATRVFSIASGFTVNISNLTVSGGQANMGGGVYNLGNLTISNMTFTGNAAVGGSGEGGAIDSEGGSLTLVNSTLSNNTAETDGGGLLSCGNSTVTLVNVTITGNRADSDNNGSGAGGGIGQVSSNALTLHNTIVAGNFNEDGATDTPDDVFVNTSLSSTINASSSNNLIGVDTGVANISNGSGGNQIGTSATPLDARLGALASNGGPTQTHALLAGSPALDAGKDSEADAASLTTDQRGAGFARKRDAASDADTTQTVDIGAFEADPSIEDISDKATTEDTALPTFTFKVGDAATAFDSITATSSNTTLVPNANINVGADTASTRTLSITPAANQSGTTTITVTVTKTISGTAVSTSDTFVLTVGTVPDTPSISPASTEEDTQTTSGLVITKNALDGAEVTHFKITAITGGTLFKNDGTTQINNGDFITVAEGGAGLKFTPAANSFAGGSFLAQASTDAVGTVLSPTATGTITVNTVADTPSVTNATTNEDTQTTSGLVISRNAADSTEVTHFKITAITGGTLFKSDGTTQITNNSFITFAEGQAGLRFTPAANLFSPSTTFSFQVQGAIGAGGAGLSVSAATATITVNTVADTPSVTNATTNEDTQTTTGLVITKNAVDGAEVTHFKITAITGGTLFKHDGVTAIGDGQFITVAEAANVGGFGLKFTPAANSNTNGSFTVQASLSGTNAGLGGGTATATITVNNVNDAPTLDAIGDLTINEDDPQQTVNFAGITAGPFETQTLTVTATSNNTGLIPNPAVNYTSPNATGTLTFTPVANQSGSALITVTVNDGGGTANGGVETVVRTFTVTVNAVNDAPVNSVPGAQGTDADTPLTFSAANSNLISISDVDAGAAAMRVTLSATNGTLTLSSTAGLAFTAGDGTADATMTFTGTLAAINAALNGMVFTPTSGFDGAASVQITTNDQGNAGAGGALSDTDTVQITVDKRSFRFSLSAYTVGEAEGRALITVTRTGGTGGTASVDYATSDLAGLNLCSVNTGDASARCDYTAIGGTLIFMPGESSKTFTVPVINDVYVEGPEVLTLTLSHVVGDIALGAPAQATLTITDNDNTPGAFNPIDTREFLIRQLYLDTLNREPEPAGLAGWLNRLNTCPPPGETIQNCDEIEVASAFFRSPEFFDRAFFLYKFYEAALGRQPQYDEYQHDLLRMTGFLTTEELELRKQQFVEEFVNRPEFHSAYDSFGSGQPFVDAVLARAGSARPGVGAAAVTTSNRVSVINRLGAGQITRAQAVRELMEAPEISQRFFNKAFVVVGYFAFLRRNPDAAYLHWINMLNNTGDYREMIRGFLQSPEFRLRFGQM